MVKKEAMTESCPCHYTRPCGPQCACANPTLTSGCRRCATHGDALERLRVATRLAAIIDRARERKPCEVDADVDLVFDDWQRNGKSIYATEEGLSLSTRDMHSGTTFHGVIRLSRDELQDLLDASEAGAHPTMRVIVRGKAP